MYISGHVQDFVGMSEKESQELVWELIDHATQPKYFWECTWSGPGDLVMWDNRSVMHKATQWVGNTEIVRDMRRTSVFDDTKYAYGVPQFRPAVPAA
jgi:alpha-ketoglutarate-dependent taurine dioxygenase